MILTHGGGPLASPTSKDGAGFLSPDALRYEAETGHPQEAPIPFDDLADDPRLHVVEDGDRLRFFIHPQLDSALTWAATYVAVDIEFSDGTRIADHGLRDQYGTDASAAGLGAGRILYANHWNDVQVDLSPAAGHTITSVLLAADAPAERSDGRPTPSTITGWIDRVRVDRAPADPPLDDPVAWVDTRRGTNASGDFSRGNNLPLTAWPNGFAFFAPATDARTARWSYQYHRANDADNRPRLQAVGVSHQPSPWMGDRNQLFLMPLAGATPEGDPEARAVAFDHADEIARPDQYAVSLADGTALQLAPTDHGMILESSFDEDAGGAHLLIEGVDENTRLDITGVVFDGTFTGWVDNGTDGSGRSAGRSRMFVAGSIDPQPEHVGAAPGGLDTARVVSFAPEVREITVRIATSFIGVEQAQHTLDQELTGRSFEQVRADAHAEWSERLGVIEVDGATAPQRRTLYGNLYRLNLYPNSHHENAGTRRSPRTVHASPVLPPRGKATDRQTNAQVRPGPMYVNHGFWDTYRTAWPAYALLYPELCADLVDGFVQHYRDGGWIPRWSSPGYADCMTGTSSDVAFADAHTKGVPLPDPLATYDAGLKNATVAPTDPLVGRKGVERGFFTGYVDTDTDESVSWALEAHINDFGLAAQAAALADDKSLPARRRTQLAEEARYLAGRSANYVHLFDPTVAFFQGRRPDGGFAQGPDEFDPHEWGGDFTETDGWNFAFHVPHDGEGLASLYGGREALREKLEGFFASEETGDRYGGYGHLIHEMIEARDVRMGQFGVSNQPAHHIPFLFHHAGAPHRAQEIVRETHRRLFVGEQIGQGYPGDEDNGEMSAWWILTALGIYPLQLGAATYHLLTPLFEQARVRPLGGPGFTITAEDQGPDNPYVQWVRHGGEDVSSSWIHHRDLVGEIQVGLGPEPGEPAEPAPSPTAPGEQPSSLVDLLPADPQNPLVDDDSRTEAHVEPVGGSVVIDLPDLESPAVAQMYTLTSARSAGNDPTAWRLEGSADGSEGSWVVLDTRTQETFRWRRQTRPFGLGEQEEARGLTHHRLVVTGADGPIALAEVELLGQA